MPITKYASFEVSEVLDVKGSRRKLDSASLSKVADYDDYRTNDGYLYVRIRAISSRVNKNDDGWPSVELAGSAEIFDGHQAGEGFSIQSPQGWSVQESEDRQDEQGVRELLRHQVLRDFCGFRSCR